MSLTSIDSANIFHKGVIGNVRSAQEDSHDIAALTPNGDVFVVCDGMGGHVGGKQASSIAVKSIIEYLQREKYPDPIQAINEALQFANMQILGYSDRHRELKGMGTTACVLLLQDSTAYIAHIGDSRIYLYLGREKQLHRVTKDHSFVQALVDAGEITDEEAEHHPNKNRILKALGVTPYVELTIDRINPKTGDIFLICSDGLSGMISDSTIRNVLSQKESISTKGDTLIQLAIEAGGLDNITLELVQISNSPHPSSLFRSYNPTSVNTSGNKAGKNVMKIAFPLIALFLAVILAGGLYVYSSRLKPHRQLTKLEQKIEQDSIKMIALKSQFLQDSTNFEKSQNALRRIKQNLKDNPNDTQMKKALAVRQEEYDLSKKTVEESTKDLSNAISELQNLREKRDSLRKIHRTFKQPFATSNTTNKK